MKYCTVEFADQYLAGRAFSSGWADGVEKEQFITLASELIEQYCTFFDDNGDAFSYADDLDVPEWLKKATAEEALYLVNLGKDPTQADKKTTLGIASADGAVFDKNFAADILCINCRRIIEKNGGQIDSIAIAGDGRTVQQGWIRK
ncbi:MAG: hypothetical protein IJW05_12395 [Lentisphaeria bacterium]|nr:hypothetical protein [Lentisphaeria bacterium]